MNSNLPGFWSWFFRGADAAPGYRRIINRQFAIHIAVGLLASSCIQADLATVAQGALLPLMAIFVGLTFSWAGNAHALLQSAEIVTFAKSRRGGIAEYIFTFQLCILLIMVTVLLWIIPILKARYLFYSLISLQHFNLAASVLLYALLSLAFRTSWQAVLGANMLLLVRSRLLDEDK